MITAKRPMMFLSSQSLARLAATALAIVLIDRGVVEGRGESVGESMTSPSGVVAAQITRDGQIGFDFLRDGKRVAGARELNVYIDSIGLGSIREAERPRVVAVSTGSETQETFKRFVPHRVGSNHYMAYEISAEASSGRAWTIELRLFDDGAAYRLRVPLEGEHRVSGDFAAWDFSEEAVIWRKTAGNRSYEDEYKPSVVGKLDDGHRFMMPVTVELPEGAGYALLTEANLVDYADVALEAGAGGDFRHVFHDSPEGWRHEGDLVTPWRVLILTGDLNGLVNSDAVQALCPPPAESLAGAGWIKPGRCLWHWLATGRPQLEAQREWIDGASQLGWEYYLIDDGWRDWNGGGDAAWDAMQRLAEYADQRDVSLWAWVHSQYLKTHEDRAAYFERAKRTGLVGLKIDFPRPANREWVNWYDETLRDAAAAELLINFHGSVKPTGRERTWPHELTREAIRGREQGKLPASHDTALPFIRFVQGHADYTPTRLVAGELRGSTFAHELAMAIAYSSPLLCMGGGYEEYLASEAADLLRDLPCTWDETIVLPPSRLGGVCALARRSGAVWYVAVIGGSDSRTLDLPLNFLSQGEYVARQFGDHPQTDAAFATETTTLTNDDVLSITMQPDGGFVAWLRPIPAR